MMASESPFHSVWLKDSASLFALSQASHAFSLIARSSSRNSSKPVRFWFPDLFCDDALKPLREVGRDLGVAIVFYPVNSDMRPDWAACSRIAGPPDYFVLVHYFGQRNDIDQARTFCDRHGAKLIEDATHVLGPAGAIGGGGDFVCYSPRKFFDVPDGGILVARDSDDAELIDDVCRRLPRRGPGTARWRLKRWERIFRRRILRRREDSKPLPRMTFKTEFVSAEPFREIAISDYSRGHLTVGLQSRRLHLLAERRKEFERLIAEQVVEMDGVALIQRDDGIVPCWIGLTCRDETTAQAALDRLRSSHILAVPWPDRLPPEISSRPEHERAVKLRNRMLLVKPTGKYRSWTL
jgi:hypothetical protein